MCCVNHFMLTCCTRDSTHLGTNVVLSSKPTANAETHEILNLVPDGCIDAECGRSVNTHQDEVRLIRWQHENRDVVVGQRCYDWFGDFGDSDGLRTGGTAAPRHHVERQPRGISNTDVLRLRQLWEWRRCNMSERGGGDERSSCPLVVSIIELQPVPETMFEMSATSVLEKMHRWWWSLEKR